MPFAKKVFLGHLILIDVLSPNNYPIIFFRGVGEKLTFNDLSTRIWDSSNNDKYERIRLVPQPASRLFNRKKVQLKKSEIRFTHENRINKYKFKLTEYLDNEITYNELKQYLYRKKSSKELDIDELMKAYKIVQRNYKNAFISKKHKLINKLFVSLNSTSDSSKTRIILNKLYFNLIKALNI